MLNRVKFVLATLALCSGFSIVANAEEVSAAASGANNSIVIIGCSQTPPSMNLESFQVRALSPADFTAVPITNFQDCAIALASLNHYGWKMVGSAVDDSDSSGADHSRTVYTLIKQ